MAYVTLEVHLDTYIASYEGLVKLVACQTIDMRE